MFYPQSRLRTAPAALLSLFLVSSISPAIAKSPSVEVTTDTVKPKKLIDNTVTDLREMSGKKAIAYQDDSVKRKLETRFLGPQLPLTDKYWSASNNKKAPVQQTKVQEYSKEQLLKSLQGAGSEIFSDSMTTKMALATVMLALVIDRATEQTIENINRPEQTNLFSWRNVRLNGMGYICGMSISPVAPYDVYIRADIGGAYRYDRRNQRWIPLMDMFSSSFSGGSVGVESVAADPVNPYRVYAVVNSVSGVSQNKENKKVNTYAGEVLVSNNRGKTWVSTGLAKHGIYVGPNDDYRNETGERLAIDPNNPKIIYFASRKHGLWRKEEQKDWTSVKGGLPALDTLPVLLNKEKEKKPGPGFTFVVFDKTTGKPGNPTLTLYVGVYGSGVWESKNAGKSWINIGDRKDPFRAAVASDGTLYVTYGTYGENNKRTGSIAKFQNGKWRDITPDRKNRVYAAINVQPDRPTVAMAVSDQMVYRTEDGGKSWQRIEMAMGSKDPNFPNASVNSSAPGYFLSYASTGAASIVIDPSNPQQVWWTNGWGVARTDNADSKKPVYTWVQENLNELAATMVRVPPKPLSDGGAELIIAAMDMIGFRVSSRDQVPDNKINPKQIPVHPASKSLANPNWDVYPVPFPHVASGTSLDYAYTKPDYMAIVGFHNWQGYWPIHGYSSNNGKTWKAFESFPVGKDKSEYASGGQIAMSPTNPLNLVWSPTWGPSTHYTMDGGKTWKPSLTTNKKPLPDSWGNRINPYLTSYILTGDKADPKGKTFYYFDGSAFYYSQDGGATWTKSKAKNFPHRILRPIILSNPLKQGDVWISFPHNPEDRQRNPLYRSTDGGKTFSKVKSVDSSELIAFGKGETNNIPAIYLFGRVNRAQKDTMYKSEDMGKTWTAISAPETLQFPAAYWMEGDMRQGNIVYVAMVGRGVMVGEIQDYKIFDVLNFTKNIVDFVIKYTNLLMSQKPGFAGVTGFLIFA
ncbi:MAG: sialidase family protein [Scytonema sp. PMC 1069.18]|nr:sialidase family protein [Scytonema sp. PMC 1069.18]MEC4886602.1 sialidase family protein [Scytonema sp. PMC 1070.18]